MGSLSEAHGSVLPMPLWRAKMMMARKTNAGDQYPSQAPSLTGKLPIKLLFEYYVLVN